MAKMLDPHARDELFENLQNKVISGLDAGWARHISVLKMHTS
jgi:hypothetical protein